MSSTIIQKRCSKTRQGHQPPRSHFVDVRIDGKLAFRYDPKRGLIQWQRKNVRHIVDLSEYSDNG